MHNRRKIKDYKKTVLIILLLNVLLCQNVFSSNIIYAPREENSIITKESPLPSEFDMKFNNKQELFDYFYGKFYEYILFVGGEPFLRENGIYNLYDFYLLNKTWTGGTAGMERVGDICGRYFLTKDPNNPLANQANHYGFIGYCIKNNILPDFIEFLQIFFYYWRLDEGYTNFSDPKRQYASNFLYDSYASVVDTAKFFFFDKKTLPECFIYKYHIPALYDNIPYIVYNKD